MTFYAGGRWAIWSDPRLITFVGLAALAVLGSGCAAVAPLSSVAGSVLPSSTLGIYNTTELRLEQKNFVIVKPNAMGQSKGFSLFGIITIFPAPFTKAMKRLYAQADMQPGTSRALANLIMEKDSTYLILFSIPRTAIRADVIEFVPPASPEALPQPPSRQTKFRTE